MSSPPSVIITSKCFGGCTSNNNDTSSNWDSCHKSRKDGKTNNNNNSNYLRLSLRCPC